MKSSKIVRFVLSASLVCSFATMTSVAMAAPAIPEIDPSTATSALAVLVSSGLILAERLGFRR